MTAGGEGVGVGVQGLGSFCVRIAGVIHGPGFGCIGCEVLDHRQDYVLEELQDGAEID